MREIICEEGGLIRSSVPFKIKRAYEDYMNDVPGAIHPDELTAEKEELKSSKKSIAFLRESLRFSRKLNRSKTVGLPGTEKDLSSSIFSVGNNRSKIGIMQTK